MPDKLLSTAQTALLSANFHSRKGGPNCTFSSPFLPFPLPAAHLHLNNDLTVSFYKKSELLWTFPSFMAFPDSEDLNVMLASDS